MKRIILLAAMLIASSAQAEVYRPLTYFTVSASTAQASHSTPVGAHTKVLRVVCTVTCVIGTAVTSATSPSVASLTAPVFLSAGREDYIKVSPGAYVHVRTDTSSGTLHVTEME